VHIYFTPGRSPVDANSVVVTICIVGVSLAECVHSSVNKPGANGRVSYDSLTHSRFYCRDMRKSSSSLLYPQEGCTKYCDQRVCLSVFKMKAA